MSEQQPTPVEIVFDHKNRIDQRTALRKGAEQLVDCYARTYQQIAGLVGEAASLAARHGKDNLAAELASIDPALSAAIDDSLAAVRTMWQACSPYPFPDFPADPVSPPEEEETAPDDGGEG